MRMETHGALGDSEEGTDPRGGGGGRLSKNVRSISAQIWCSAIVAALTLVFARRASLSICNGSISFIQTRVSAVCSRFAKTYHFVAVTLTTAA